jgi:rRNA-processing protein EBP2
MPSLLRDPETFGKKVSKEGKGKAPSNGSKKVALISEPVESDDEEDEDEDEDGEGMDEDDEGVDEDEEGMDEEEEQDEAEDEETAVPLDEVEDVDEDAVPRQKVEMDNKVGSH